MSRRPARFTEAEARRLAKVAKEIGCTVEFVEGRLRMVPLVDDERKKVEEAKKLEQWDEVAF